MRSQGPVRLSVFKLRAAKARVREDEFQDVAETWIVPSRWARVAPLLRAQARVEAQRQGVVRLREHAAAERVAVGGDAAESQRRTAILAGPLE